MKIVKNSTRVSLAGVSGLGLIGTTAANAEKKITNFKFGKYS